MLAAIKQKIFELSATLLTLFQGYDWSWAILAVCYLIAALVVRSWFLRPLKWHIREVDKSVRKRIRKYVRKRGLLGWILFLIPFLIVMLLWYRRTLFSPSLRDLILLGIGGVCYLLSIIFHLQTYGVAALRAMREAAGQAVAAD